MPLKDGFQITQRYLSIAFHLIRPHLEHQLEQVQRQRVRIIRGPEAESYEEKLEDMSIFSFKKRQW